MLKGDRKHRYTANKMDFTFNRLCDGTPSATGWTGRSSCRSSRPLADDYELFKATACVLDSSRRTGKS